MRTAEDRRAYQKAYRQKHAARLRKQNRKWYRANRDRARSVHKAYYRKHRRRLLARVRAYYLAHRQKRLDYQKKYAATHEKQERVRKQRWANQNRCYANAYQRAYRVKNWERRRVIERRSHQKHHAARLRYARGRVASHRQEILDRVFEWRCKRRGFSRREREFRRLLLELRRWGRAHGVRWSHRSGRYAPVNWN